MSYGIRKLRSDYYTKKIEESTGDSKATWKILKEVINKDQKRAEINEINVDGQTVTDKKTISETLNQHFVSIGERLAGEILDPFLTSSEYLSKTGNLESKLSSKTIQPKHVFATISKLKNGKATGLNMIPNTILKCSKNVISQSLADTFNTSIQSGIFPDDFKMGGVTPIFKEGEKGDVSNYLPISILCTVARGFEKLLYNQLHQYLVQHNVLCSPREVLPNKEVRGGLDLTSSLEAKFGARSGQVHHIREKNWEVLSPQDAKVGEKSQFWGHI